MRVSRKFCQRESNTDTVFFKFRREDPNTNISGPLSVRQRNAIEMAFRWRTDYGPKWNAGLVSRLGLLRNPIFIRLVRGSEPPVRPLDPHIRYY